MHSDPTRPAFKLNSEELGNQLYQRTYASLFLVILIALMLLMILIGIIFYQVTHRPLPQFSAKNNQGETLTLTSFDEPNLLPDTILRWATKAATAAFNFDFVNYQKQISAARPFFTEHGWQDYLVSMNGAISSVVQKQLFVNGVAAGAPVIANQGDIPGKGYTWRVQIPYIVSYEGANNISVVRYMVILSILKIPTSTNPQGIGIEQLIMAGR